MLAKLEAIQKEFNGARLSLADLIVLGGAAAVEKAAKDAGVDVKVPFTPGRDGRVAGPDRCRDPSRRSSRGPTASATTSAASGSSWRRKRRWWTGRSCWRLTAPEMTVLVGGLRVLGANAGDSKHGVFTKKPGTLTNDFFVNLLDMSTEWQPAGRRRLRRPRPQDQGGEVDRHARRPDLRVALAASRTSRKSTPARTPRRSS